MSADITIIQLWPPWFTCQRCNKDTLHAEAWPFYEDLGCGYVPVCGDCGLWLRVHANELWRGPLEWSRQ